MQVAVLAEFRKEWDVALRAYEAGYQELERIPLGTCLPLQRFFELTACAELLHFKACVEGLDILLFYKVLGALLTTSCLQHDARSKVVSQMRSRIRHHELMFRKNKHLFKVQL